MTSTLPHAVGDTTLAQLTAALPGCAQCVDLEAAGRDPALRLTTGSLHLSRLIDHHIDAHDAQGFAVSSCAACARWSQEYILMAPRLVAWWSRHHFVGHQLGLVWDGAGFPLRFADMPAPVQRHRIRVGS